MKFVIALRQISLKKFTHHSFTLFNYWYVYARKDIYDKIRNVSAVIP